MIIEEWSVGGSLLTILSVQLLLIAPHLCHSAHARDLYLLNLWASELQLRLHELGRGARSVDA